MPITIPLVAADGAKSSVTLPDPPVVSSGGIIPADRLFPWKPGVTYNGGIPNRTTVYKTLTPSGGDDTAQIQNAVSACPAGQVVLLAAGTFIVGGGNAVITVPSNITLRGAGAGQTILNKTNGAFPRSTTAAPYTDGKIFEPQSSGSGAASAFPIMIIGAPIFTNGYGAPTALTADAAQGATSITVASATGLAVGQYVVLDEMTNASWKPCNLPANQDNTTSSSYKVWGGDRVTYNIHLPYLQFEDDCSGSNATNPFDTSRSGNAPAVPGGFAPYITVDYSRYDRLINEIKQITGIAGNTVTFSTPASISYRTSHTAQITPVTPAFIVNSGVESLTMIGGADGALSFGNAAHCWAKNIEVTQWLGVGVDFASAFQCELRDSYIHTGSWPVPGGGGYAIGFDWASSECLVENNISIDTCKNIVARAAGAGCVVAYNYMDDAWDGAEGQETWQECGINGSHLAGSHHILFEGNYGFNFDSDYTHGGSSYHTVFCNALTGKRRNFTDTMATGGANLRCVGLAAYSTNFSFVGNILGLNNPDVVHWSYADPSMSCDANGGNCTGNNANWGGTGDIWKIGYDPERWNALPEPGTLSTVIRDGNYDFLTNSQRWHSTPARFIIPNSLYLASKPAFFGGSPWPWVNPATGAVTALPAKVRFDAGTPNAVL